MSQAERNKKIARVSLLSACAIIISAFESFIPLPVPGMKLGIANTVIIYTLYKLGAKESFFVFLVKCFVSALLFGTLTSFVYSAVGGALSVCSALIIKKKGKRCFSYIGVCIIGAACHSIGQMSVCCMFFVSLSPLYYLPIMLVCSVFCGLVTGTILNIIPEKL